MIENSEQQKRDKGRNRKWPKECSFETFTSHNRTLDGQKNIHYCHPLLIKRMLCVEDYRFSVGRAAIMAQESY